MTLVIIDILIVLFLFYLLTWPKSGRTYYTITVIMYAVCNAHVGSVVAGGDEKRFRIKAGDLSRDVQCALSLRRLPGAPVMCRRHHPRCRSKLRQLRVYTETDCSKLTVADVHVVVAIVTVIQYVSATIGWDVVRAVFIAVICSCSIHGNPKKLAHFVVRLNSIKFKYWQIFKLIHRHNHENICNNTVSKDPTIPQIVCRYTTLWNVSVLKQLK